MSNQKHQTNKTWKVFGDQTFTNYFSFANNMFEHTIGYRYFNSHLTLFAYGFLIDELKNIFIATIPQFLKEKENYNRKTACKVFKDKYD